MSNWTIKTQIFSREKKRFCFYLSNISHHYVTCIKIIPLICDFLTAQEITEKMFSWCLKETTRPENDNNLISYL